MPPNHSQTLRFDDGAVQFRQRIVCSLLSNRTLLLRNIRIEGDDPDSDNTGSSDNDTTPAFGLQPHEASFLHLIDSLTNGSRIEINTTGTQLRFVPGILLGGTVHHDCTLHRSIGWYLEGIFPLSPFGKEPLSLTLTGITDGDAKDPSCDYWTQTVLPLLDRLGVGVDTPDRLSHAAAPHLTCRTRGAAPAGGGTVHWYCPTVRSELTTVLDWTDVGLVKRVRGRAVSTKLVSSSQTARVAYAAKGVLHRRLPDVWIHTDSYTVRHHQCGPSPSLSLVLTASTTTGAVYVAETVANSSSATQREVPEDMGVRGAVALLEEIRRGGVLDTGVQSLALLFMCLAPEDVNRIRLGTLTPYTIQSLRLFKQAFGVEFKLTPCHQTKTVLLSCLGTGYRNMARAST